MKYFISHTKDWRWYVYKMGYGPTKYFDTQAEALEYLKRLQIKLEEA
jgi:hypothetical protein